MLPGMWRRRDDPMEMHGLRPLTWRDGLFWRRLGDAGTLAAVWTIVAVWALSKWYTPGPWTVTIVAVFGCAGGVGAMIQQRDDADLARWPRRDDI